MEQTTSEGVSELNWNGDYKELDRLCAEVSFDDAYRTFIKSTGLDEYDSDLSDIGTDQLDVIRNTTGLAVSCLVPLPENPSNDCVKQSVDRWINSFGKNFHPDFLKEICEFTGISDERQALRVFLERLSVRLPAFERNFLIARHSAIEQHVESVPGAGDNIRILYYLTMLNVLFAKRFPVYIRDFSSEPIVSSDLESFEPSHLFEMTSLMGSVIDIYQALVTGGSDKPYPVEFFLQRDAQAIQKYCRALLRLVIGPRYNFSQVLQEDLIFSEAKHLAKRYGFLDKSFQKCLAELRDLRERIFAHVNLIVGHKCSNELVYPPGFFIHDEPGLVLDLGAGPDAWFSNAVAKIEAKAKFSQNRGVVAYDKRQGDSLSQNFKKSPFMEFKYIDFDDRGEVKKLVDDYAGRVRFILASNILHKLDRPELLLDAALDILHDKGILYIYAPAYSKHLDSSIISDVKRQDVTRHCKSIWPFEDILDVVVKRGALIRAWTVTGSERGENDSIPRTGLAVQY